MTHEPISRASDPPSWKIGSDRAPAGRERLRPGWEAAKGCGEHTVPAEVPGCQLMVTEAAGGLPPTSAGTSLILAEKHSGLLSGRAAPLMRLINYRRQRAPGTVGHGGRWELVVFWGGGGQGAMAGL